MSAPTRKKVALRRAENTGPVPARQPAPTGAHSNALALQRKAGNRAVNAALGGGPGQAPPIVGDVLRSGSEQARVPRSYKRGEQRSGEKQPLDPATRKQDELSAHIRLEHYAGSAPFPGMIVFNRPVTLEEATQYLWSDPPEKFAPLLSDPTEYLSEGGKQTRFLLDAPDNRRIAQLGGSMQHGLGEEFLKSEPRLYRWQSRSINPLSRYSWIPPDLAEQILQEPPGTWYFDGQWNIKGKSYPGQFVAVIKQTSLGKEINVIQQRPSEEALKEIFGGREYAAYLHSLAFRKKEQRIQELLEEGWSLDDAEGIFHRETQDQFLATIWNAANMTQMAAGQMSHRPTLERPAYSNAEINAATARAAERFSGGRNVERPPNGRLENEPILVIPDAPSGKSAGAQSERGTASTRSGGETSGTRSVEPSSTSQKNAGGAMAGTPASQGRGERSVAPTGEGGPGAMASEQVQMAGGGVGVKQTPIPGSGQSTVPSKAANRSTSNTAPKGAGAEALPHQPFNNQIPRLPGEPEFGNSAEVSDPRMATPKEHTPTRDIAVGPELPWGRKATAGSEAPQGQQNRANVDGHGLQSGKQAQPREETSLAQSPAEQIRAPGEVAPPRILPGGRQEAPVREPDQASQKIEEQKSNTHPVQEPDQAQQPMVASSSKGDNVLAEGKAGNRLVEKNGRYFNVPPGMSSSDIPPRDPVGDRMQEAIQPIADSFDPTKNLTREQQNEVLTGESPYMRMAQYKGTWVQEQMEAQFPQLDWFRRGPDAKGTTIYYEIHSGTISNSDRHLDRPGMPNKMWRLIFYTNRSIYEYVQRLSKQWKFPPEKEPEPPTK